MTTYLADDSHEWAMAPTTDGYDDRPEPYEYQGLGDLLPSPNTCRSCGWVPGLCECGGAR